MAYPGNVNSPPGARRTILSANGAAFCFGRHLFSELVANDDSTANFSLHFTSRLNLPYHTFHGRYGPNAGYGHFPLSLMLLSHDALRYPPVLSYLND